MYILGIYIPNSFAFWLWSYWLKQSTGFRCTVHTVPVIDMDVGRFFLFHSSCSHSPDHGPNELIQHSYEKQLCQLNGSKLLSLFARLLWMHKPVAAALKMIWLVQ